MYDERNVETFLIARDINEKIIGITYAFNRLLITTSKRVYWSNAGLGKGENEEAYINGGANFKESDSISSNCLGCWSDGKRLFLATEAGYEIWIPTQDMDSPFIYEKAAVGRVAAFCSQFLLMETEERRMGLFSMAEEKFLTDQRWTVKPEGVRGMKTFWLPQNGSKVLAIYENSQMWLMDYRHKLMTRMAKPFYPHYEFLNEFMDMQISLMLDKGVYSSLFIQLGNLPQRITFFIDNFCMKRAPLIAFERDDVIKTMNIGKLAADTPIELNFKGYVSIYSLGLDKPGV